MYDEDDLIYPDFALEPFNSAEFPFALQAPFGNKNSTLTIADF